MKDVSAALRRGAAFISGQQQADGSFASLASGKADDFSGAELLSTIFPNSIILAALCATGQPQLEPVRSRAAAFLLTQKSDNWSFNYWNRDSREHHAHPYPDDLDDTFCALAALRLHDASLLDGAVLAAATRLLITTEKQAGGPYRTWLAQAQAGERWGDIDLAVNANIGWFLSLQGVQVPGVVRLVERAIKQGVYASPYYPDDTVTLYFIARWYQGKHRIKLRDTLRAQLDAAEADNLLRTALLVTSLLRLGADAGDCTRAVDRLLAAQQPDGRWAAAAFCLDSASGNTARYVGSPVLTTALCLEALALYAQAQSAGKPARRGATYQRIIADVEREIGDITQPDLRRSTHQALRRVLTGGNEQQIALLPYVVAKAAEVHVPAADVLQQLAAANLWGWTAYTICDDFLDGEGKPALLPGAVACLRRLHATLHATLPGNRAFHTEIQHILDRTDAANAWELAHCRSETRGDRLYITKLPRYGNYWQLADRSLGHTIAGLGVLYGAGCDSDDPRLVALRVFFRHYLIARQLNDDAHDWEDDLRRGHINAAGALIVKHWLEQAGNSLTQGIPLETAREALQSSMWEHVIDEMARLIFRHTATARRAIAGVRFNPTPFETMLKPLDTAAREALDTRQITADFLANLSEG